MKKFTSGNEIIRALVIFGDIIILNLLLLFFFTFFHDLVPPYFVRATKIMVVVTNFTMLLSEYLIPPIIQHHHLTFEHVVEHVLKLTLLHTAISFVFLRLIGDSGGMFRFMLIFAITEFVAIMFIRFVERKIIKQLRKLGRNTRSVIFVGSDPANMLVYEELCSESSTGYRFTGYYSNDTITNCPEGLERLGSLDELNMKFETNEIKADEIFCCLAHSAYEQIERIMKYCDENVIHFYYVPRMLGNYRLNLKPKQFGNLALFTNHQEPLLNPVNRIIKRTFDIVMSLIVCLCMLPFIPIIALIIKTQSPGPVLFKQKRTGLNGNTFECLKFRSMHVNDSADTAQATKDDPRKFAFGNFMRKTNIDELPQFWNVLRGDMSIVGPRPHMLYHTETYKNLIDKYMVRHFCKPGITGWAQVTGFRGETKELWQMEERVKRDIWYIENWSFWLDIRIILMTVKSIFVPDKKAF